MSKKRTKTTTQSAPAPASLPPSSKRLGLLLLPAFITFAGALTWQLWPSSKTEPPAPPTRPFEAPSDASDPKLWFDRTAPFDTLFVGAAACKSCHTQEHASWSERSHAAAMQEATPQTVLGNFRDTVFSGDGIYAKALQKDSSFYLETDDRNGQRAPQKIAYVLGSRRSQEYLTQKGDGRLQILPTAFSLLSKQWYAPLSLTIGAISPQSTFFWENARRTFNRECFDCHVTGMEVRYDAAQDRYETQWAELGVSCESCHGPGEQHAEKPTLANIINPKKLSQERQTSLCGRCHSARVMHFSQFDREHTFFPGDLYEEYFSPILLGQLGPNGAPSFYPDMKPKEPGLEYQSLLQSRCYQNSKMTCSTCHSDHSDVKPNSNTLCGGCHNKEYQNISKHSKHKADGEAALCVSCHMPKLVPSLSGAVTDHTIDIPNPDNTKSYDIPNACMQCHSDQTATWSSSQYRVLYRQASLARRSDLLAIFLGVGEPKEAKKFEDPLIALLQDTKESPLIRAVAVNALRGFRSQKSTASLVAALSDKSVWVRANAAAGLAFLGNDHKTPEATRALTRALSDSSLWVRLQAATSLFAFGEPIARETIESWVTSDYPNWYRLRALLALNAAQRNLPDFAQEEIRVALLDKPDFVEMYRLLAGIFLQKNEPARAKESFQMLLRFDPSDAEAKKALAQ